MGKEFKLGVYMKPNGNLVSVEENHVSDRPHMKYCVIDGRKISGPIAKLLYPKLKDRPYLVLESSSLNLGWGPSRYLNECEYLGEL